MFQGPITNIRMQNEKLTVDSSYKMYSDKLHRVEHTSMWMYYSIYLHIEALLAYSPLPERRERQHSCRELLEPSSSRGAELRDWRASEQAVRNIYMIHIQKYWFAIRTKFSL
jgi:hypothetical protein